MNSTIMSRLETLTTAVFELDSEIAEFAYELRTGEITLRALRDATAKNAELIEVLNEISAEIENDADASDELGTLDVYEAIDRADVRERLLEDALDALTKIQQELY